MHQLDFTRIPGLSVKATISENAVSNIDIRTDDWYFSCSDMMNRDGVGPSLQHGHILDKYENFEKYTTYCPFLATTAILQNLPAVVYQNVKDKIICAPKFPIDTVAKAVSCLADLAGVDTPLDIMFLGVEDGIAAYTNIVGERGQNNGIPYYSLGSTRTYQRLLDQIADAALPVSGPEVHAEFACKFMGQLPKSFSDQAQNIAYLQKFIEKTNPESLEKTEIQDLFDKINMSDRSISR